MSKEEIKRHLENMNHNIVCYGDLLSDLKKDSALCMDKDILGMINLINRTYENLQSLIKF